MSAGERITGIANLIIPEVLIGEVAHKVDRLITPTCADAQVFFYLKSETVIANGHTSFHFGSLSCFFPLVRRGAARDNQGPRGIDW